MVKSHRVMTRIILSIILASCLLTLVTGGDEPPNAYVWSDAPEEVPPTTIVGNTLYKVARNLWLHGISFYALLKPEDLNAYTNNSFIEYSPSISVSKFPVYDIRAHQDNINSIWLEGTTLWIDHPNPSIPEDLGVWIEIMSPIKALLSSSEVRIHTIFFPNLQRSQVSAVSWINSVTKLVVDNKKNKRPPTVLFWNDVQFEDNSYWVGFEQVITLLPRATREPLEAHHSLRSLREEAYAYAQVSKPSGWDSTIPPKTITYLLPCGDDPPIVNNGAVLRVLREVGQSLGMKVRPYSITSRAAFSSHVAAMSRTGVLVARHGSLLANALFLPPGAVVFEALPYNWDLENASLRYKNITRRLGDVTHVAWRGSERKWSVYQPGDEKYSLWTGEQCMSTYCIKAHERAGLIINVEAMRRMLLDLVPQALLGGASAQSLESRWPWPHIPYKHTTNGMWWNNL